MAQIIDIKTKENKEVFTGRADILDDYISLASEVARALKTLKSQRNDTCTITGPFNYVSVASVISNMHIPGLTVTASANKMTLTRKF